MAIRPTVTKGVELVGTSSLRGNTGGGAVLPSGRAESRSARHGLEPHHGGRSQVGPGHPEDIVRRHRLDRANIPVREIVAHSGGFVEGGVPTEPGVRATVEGELSEEVGLGAFQLAFRHTLAADPLDLRTHTLLGLSRAGRRGADEARKNPGSTRAGYRAPVEYARHCLSRSSLKRRPAMPPPRAICKTLTAA